MCVDDARSARLKPQVATLGSSGVFASGGVGTLSSSTYKLPDVAINAAFSDPGRSREVWLKFGSAGDLFVELQEEFDGNGGSHPVRFRTSVSAPWHEACGHSGQVGIHYYIRSTPRPHSRLLLGTRKAIFSFT